MKEIFDSLLGIAFCVLSIAYVYRARTRDKGNDKAGAERSLIIGLIFLVLAGQARAQGNWRILIERDTMAIGPLNDVRRWAGLRMAKNETARQCAWELAQRGKELSSLYAERAKCDKAQEGARLLIASHAGRIEELSDHNRKLSRKVKRRTPFVPLLVGIVVGFVIHEQLGR